MLDDRVRISRAYSERLKLDLESKKLEYQFKLQPKRVQFKWVECERLSHSGAVLALYRPSKRLGCVPV